MVASPASTQSGFSSPNAFNGKQNKSVSKQKSFSDVANLSFSSYTTPNNYSHKIKRQNSSPQALITPSSSPVGHGKGSSPRTPGSKGRFSPKPLFSTPINNYRHRASNNASPQQQHQARSSPRPIPFPMNNGGMQHHYHRNSQSSTPTPNSAGGWKPMGARTRNPSTSSSAMSISPTPSQQSSPRSSCSPGRASPPTCHSPYSTYASTKCYQAPEPCDLPKPPLQWQPAKSDCHSEMRSVIAADPSMELMVMLNVMA